LDELIHLLGGKECMVELTGRKTQVVRGADTTLKLFSCSSKGKA